MRRTNQNDAQVHSKVEDLEYLWLCESQNYDACKLGECNSRQNLRGDKALHKLVQKYGNITYTYVKALLMELDGK